MAATVHAIVRILWKLRSGAPWCDILEDLCPWQTVYNHLNRWASKTLWENFFKLRSILDTERVLIDESYRSVSTYLNN
ncbi:transposase [Acinetobacter sp.]|uniref:transposase n=1 Tax=Acinetobacter sp. TaxID=472 RepID=UPI003BB0AFFF